MKSLSILLAALVFVLAPLGARSAWACSGGMSAHNAAFPGAAGAVSPQSSVFVVTGVDELPAGLTVQVNGAAAPLPTVLDLGRGLAADGFATFFRLAGPLEASSDYVVEVAGAGGAPVALTHFQTAAGYDKTPGTAAVINGLRLWRVHYPKSVVNAGGCVGSEYEGYFALDFAPASLPGTPAGETVSVLSLTSQDLGTTQQFVFTGDITSLPGGLTTVLQGDGVTLPDGGALSAPAALWRPNLEPGRMYCATIASYGRNDLAIGPAQSNAVCAVPVAVDAPGATGGGSAGAGGAAGAGGGASGGRGGAGAGGAADQGGSSGGPGGAATIYPSCNTGFAGPCLGDDMVKTGGCDCATAPGGDAGAVAAILAALTLIGLRRGRRRSDV